MTGVVLVFVSVPDAAVGERLARVLVEERLAACVTVSDMVQSTYRWRGAVTTEAERQMVLKTTQERVAAIERRLADLHPYELPECLIVPVSGGSPAYLEWVRAEVADR